MTNRFDILPIEIVDSIVNYQNMGTVEALQFAMTCKRHRDIVYNSHSSYGTGDSPNFKRLKYAEIIKNHNKCQEIEASIRELSSDPKAVSKYFTNFDSKNPALLIPFVSSMVIGAVNGWLINSRSTDMESHMYAASQSGYINAALWGVGNLAYSIYHYKEMSWHNIIQIVWFAFLAAFFAALNGFSVATLGLGVNAASIIATLSVLLVSPAMTQPKESLTSQIAIAFFLYYMIGLTGSLTGGISGLISGIFSHELITNLNNMQGNMLTDSWLTRLIVGFTLGNFYGYTTALPVAVACTSCYAINTAGHRFFKHQADIKEKLITQLTNEKNALTPKLMPTS